MGDHRRGRGEHLLLRHESLDVHAWWQGPESSRVGGLADGQQHPDRQAGEAVDDGGVQVREQAVRGSDRAERDVHQRIFAARPPIRQWL